MTDLLKNFSEWQWYLWCVSCGIVGFLAYRKRRNPRLSTDQLMLTVALSLASIFSLTKVLLYLAANKTEMQTKLDWDGMVAITIGCGLSILISLREIRKLL
jgi:CHASE2 domain-containing sensor protein